MRFNHLGLPVRDYTSFKCLDPDGHRVEVYWEPLVTGGA